MSRRWPSGPSRRASRFNAPPSQAPSLPFITARRARLVVAPRTQRFLAVPLASTAVPAPMAHRSIRAASARRGRIFQIPLQTPAPAPPAWIPAAVTPVRPRTLREARHARIFQVPIPQAVSTSRETLWRLGTPTNGWQFGTPVIS